MKKRIRFSIVGGAGFRAQHFLKIAQVLPDQFHVCGMVIRDESKGAEMERKWSVSTYRTLDQLLENEQPEFVVVSVSEKAIVDVLIELAERGIPILAETPPATNLEGLMILHDNLTLKGARIQVAEQYHLQPMHVARQSIIESGWLGNITETTVSLTQTYHAVSLIRKILGVGFEPATIRATKFKSLFVEGPGRSGPPVEEKIVDSERDIAWIEFDGKLGIYDFTKRQHRAWIRSNHVSVRGERGEIFDDRLNVLQDFATPLHLDLKRINKGELENVEGYYLEGIITGERWVYRNPFIPGRLYDDEIAIACCLRNMAIYAAGGPSSYSLQEASQDQYLGILIEQAIHTGETVTAKPQPWAENLN